MFEASKPFSIGNKDSSGTNVFSFGSSAQTSAPTPQSAFSFGTPLHPDKPQSQPALEAKNGLSSSSISTANAPNPLNQPSTGFSFGNPFQKTDTSSTMINPLQTSNTQNTSYIDSYESHISFDRRK